MLNVRTQNNPTYIVGSNEVRSAGGEVHSIPLLEDIARQIFLRIDLKYFLLQGTL